MSMCTCSLTVSTQASKELTTPSPEVDQSKGPEHNEVSYADYPAALQVPGYLINQANTIRKGDL